MFDTVLVKLIALLSSHAQLTLILLVIDLKGNKFQHIIPPTHVNDSVSKGDKTQF